MSETKWGNREVKSITEKPGKFGTYKVLTTIDGKGKQREEKLFDRSLQELITKTGAYQFGYELGDSGFPEIVDIRPLNGSTSSETNSKQLPPSDFQKKASGASLRDPDTNRSILVQVCIKSAAEVYQCQPDAASQGQPPVVIQLAEEFLQWAEQKLKSPQESAKEMEEHVPF